MAWVLDQAPPLIPIPGTRTADHLTDWVGASEITLTDQNLARVADVIAEIVVDPSKPVYVEGQHGSRPPIPPSSTENAVEIVVESPEVGKPGQRVVHGSAAQAFRRRP